MFEEREIRPGVFYSFRDGVRERLTRVACQVCGQPGDDPIDYILHDIIWRKLVPGGGILCLVCLEQRLGRKTVLSDFKPGFAPGLMLRRDETIRRLRQECTHQPHCVDGVAETGQCHCHVHLAELIAYDRAEALLNADVAQAQAFEDGFFSIPTRLSGVLV
jgi:hypothetical protein